MKKIIPAFLFYLISIPLFANPADVTDISNSKYFPALLNAIRTAQKSVYCCLYYISYFPDQHAKVEQILTALIDASKRGVKVEVILDQGYESGEEGDMTGKNVRAYSFLKQSGIPVFYDDNKTITHAKYFIIDEKTTILGSFNLSESSLSLNRESGVLIQSPEIAQSFMNQYSLIPKFTPEPVKDAIPIPVEFLRNKDLAPKLMVNSYPVGFDFYLLCQKKSFDSKSATIEFTGAEIENFCKNDLLQGFRDDPIQKFMNKAMLKIRKKYSFIKAYHHDLVKKTLVIELTAENKPVEDSLYISPLYWSDGWDKRLSQRSKFCLLYILDKTSSGRFGRSFSQEKYDAVKEYGVSQQIFANGTTELQRFNLIEKDINFKIGERNANGFILNDFYIYSDFQSALDKLKSETDPDMFQTVSGLADSVNEVSDLEVFKRFIVLGRKYGLEPLKQVLNLCRSHSNGISPYRQFAYVEQAVINAGEKIK